MAATHPFNVVVTDSLGGTATQPFTLNLAAAALPDTVTITSPAIAAQVTNGNPIVYSATAQVQTGGASSGPYTFSLVGAPAGWSIGASSGVVSSPVLTQAGTFFFTVKVSNNNGTISAVKNVGYTVTAIPVVVPPTQIAPVLVPIGPFQLDKLATMTVPVTITGAGPFTYSVNPAVAAWASVSPAGVLTMNGPTAPTGNQQITVSVLDANGVAVSTIVSVYIGTLTGFLTRMVNASKSLITRLFKVV